MCKHGMVQRAKYIDKLCFITPVDKESIHFFNKKHDPWGKAVFKHCVIGKTFSPTPAPPLHSGTVALVRATNDLGQALDLCFGM